MTRSPLILIVGCLAMATPAHGTEINGRQVALGASSHLTCGQFLALPKEDRDGAESWAYGYISAWQEALLAMAERTGDDLMQTAQGLPVKPPRASKFMADVAALCQEHPATLYVDAIGSMYQTWRKQTEIGRGTGSPPRTAAECSQPPGWQCNAIGQGVGPLPGWHGEADKVTGRTIMIPDNLPAGTALTNARIQVIDLARVWPELSNEERAAINNGTKILDDLYDAVEEPGCREEHYGDTLFCHDVFTRIESSRYAQR
jgi:hypothetical protein